MGDDHDEAYEVYGSEGGTTCFSRDAIGGCVDAVVHDAVPVFAGGDAEEEEDGGEEVAKVLIFGIKHL